MKTEILFIATDGKKTVNSKETLKQIEKVKSLECLLEHEGKGLTWDNFDDPEEPRTLFHSILGDRVLRVDKKTFMADRPSFVVITAMEGKAVRLEYYEGHDALSLVYDVRAKELQGKDLPNFMDKDPQAYDPVKFLKDAFGIPEGISKPLLNELHREKDGNLRRLS